MVQTTSVPTTGQPNEITIMSVGNGQPDRFLVSRSDGMQMGEISLLPSISQVWSNSNFVSNQELTNQMLLAAGQLAYNQQPQLQQLQQQEQQRRSAEEANAQRINGNHPQLTTQYRYLGNSLFYIDDYPQSLFGFFIFPAQQPSQGGLDSLLSVQQLSSHFTTRIIWGTPTE